MDEMTPEVARTEIERMRGTDEIKNVMHPSHEAALRTLSDLYSRAYPQEEAAEQQTPTEAPNETPTPEAPTPQVFEGVPEAEVQGLADLKSEWGAEFDAKIQQAQGLAAEFTRTYGDEFVEWMETSRAGSHPLVVKAFAAWAGGQSGPEVTPSEARELVKVLRSGEYYSKGNSKMHDVLKDVITRLYEVGYSEE